MSAYYNEIDPFAAQWLRHLIAKGLIAPGDVDERSIEDVRPDEIAGYTQCHFFAGIGVWSYALRLAGWPDDKPVWTGSCPCQPFSAAGKRKGTADERHLWPAFHHLIRECRPAVVFGEQVASPDGLAWLDLVCADMEGEGYAVGASDLCAAGVGAPHIRQRLYWVADATSQRHDGRWTSKARYGGNKAREQSVRLCDVGGLAFSDSDRREARREAAETVGHRDTTDADGRTAGFGRTSPTDGFWRDADWLRCRDGRWRPVEPGTFPLAHGASARVGRLRAYGNAIVPQVAAVFVRAVMEAMP